MLRAHRAACGTGLDGGRLWCVCVCVSVARYQRVWPSRARARACRGRRLVRRGRALGHGLRLRPRRSVP